MHYIYHAFLNCQNHAGLSVLIDEFYIILSANTAKKFHICRRMNAASVSSIKPLSIQSDTLQHAVLSRHLKQPLTCFIESAKQNALQDSEFM
ncbi:MAG TPA: hypothetical protein DCG57_09160 [Candidatus Riflebacteria bacterium]|nr:hypothetical protein [Candidatus Riflebacteria bacterium]